MQQCKKILYGITDFKAFQEEPYYYVDKTRYIPKIEAAGKYLFFLRPRRLGIIAFRDTTDFLCENEKVC